MSCHLVFEVRRRKRKKADVRSSRVAPSPLRRQLLSCGEGMSNICTVWQRSRTQDTCLLRKDNDHEGKPVQISDVSPRHRGPSQQESRASASVAEQTTTPSPITLQTSSDPSGTSPKLPNQTRRSLPSTSPNCRRASIRVFQSCRS